MLGEVSNQWAQLLLVWGTNHWVELAGGRARLAADQTFLAVGSQLIEGYGQHEGLIYGAAKGFSLDWRLTEIRE